MKRFLIILPFLFRHHFGFSQFDVSAGMFYRNDITFRKNADLEPVYKTDPDQYIGYSLRLNQIVDHYEFGLEFQVYGKSIDLENVQISSTYGGHYDTGSSERKYLSGHLNYGYLGTRFHFSRILYNTRINNLLFGGFLQVDGLLYERESNHRDSTITSSSGIGYDYENDVIVYTNSTTYADPVYDTFNLVDMKKAYISIGANIGHRFHYKNLFSEFRATLGLNVGLPRYQFHQFGSNETGWSSNKTNTKVGFYQFDLKIGYQF